MESDVTGNLQEIVFTVSDQHLGEGPTVRLPVRRRVRGWLRRLRGLAPEPPAFIEAQNVIEDFPFDAQFAAFVRKIMAEHASARTVWLRLLGDIFDPLAVRYRGKLTDPPYESVAAEKMAAIIVGHPAYFDALAEFLRAPSSRLDIFIGNHDFFLVWPAVQELIRRRVCKDDQAAAGRLRFVDQRLRFEVVQRGILYYHGHNAEDSSSIDPDQAIITERGGRPLPEPILNAPYSSYLVADLVSDIKQYNSLVGRTLRMSAVWREAALYRWWWTLYTVGAFFWCLIRHWLFAMWDIQRKSGFVAMFRLAFAGEVSDAVDAYSQRLLQDRRPEGIHTVVMGHSHEPRFETGQHGTYLNTGTWSTVFTIREPEFPRRWKKYPGIEAVWHNVRTLISRGRLPSARRMLAAIGVACLALIAAALLLPGFPPPGATILGYPLGAGLLSLLLLVGFLLLAFLLDMVALTPERIPGHRFTFALAEHYADAASDRLRLMEYDDVAGTFVGATVEAPDVLRVPA